MITISSAVAQGGTEGPPTVDEAPIAFMIDLSTGQTLYARNETRRFAPASVTKVMTTFVAFERLESGKMSLAQRYPMTQDIFDEWYRKGSTMFIPRDASPSVDELLHGITTVSANDGAIVLATGAAGSVKGWTDAMNATARDLGMKDSHFGTPNGWPDGGATFVTARDLATLASAMVIRHRQKYRHFIGVSGYSYDGISQSNHDPITGRVLGADGIKTGFTNEAGFTFLGTAQRANQRLVMVVAGSDTGKVRNEAARRFLEWGFEAFERRLLFVKDQSVGVAQVQNATDLSVELAAARPIFANIPRAEETKVSLRIIYEGPLRAPIEMGENVARLEVGVEGFEPFTVPLYARSAVREASVTQRIINAFASWVA